FLLDEPLSNLDAKLRNSARDELKQFQRNLGTTTVYVTHDQAEAMGLGDRIAVLNQGRVCQIGTPQEIYQDPADIFVATFIGSPPMTLLGDGENYLGFRPEAFLPQGIEPPGDNVGFPFRVTRIEYLGADRLIYGLIEGRPSDVPVISKIPTNIRTEIASDQIYQFVVRREDIQRFARSSGQRIPAGRRSAGRGNTRGRCAGFPRGLPTASGGCCPPCSRRRSSISSSWSVFRFCCRFITASRTRRSAAGNSTLSGWRTS